MKYKEEQREVSLVDSNGKVIFSQKVSAPAVWSDTAVMICASKYFRGKLGTKERESSIEQMVDRVVNTIFADDQQRYILKELMMNQKASFNSPVWFNVGVPGRIPQVSACQPYFAKVLTESGYVEIGKLVESNAIGTKLISPSGDCQIVAVKQNGNKKVLNIKTSIGDLFVTEDHLVFSFGTKSKTAKAVRADSIQIGDNLECKLIEDNTSSNYNSKPYCEPKAKVLAIEPFSESIPVYDIQTTTGDYISDGIRVHNCFILSVDDNMESILDLMKTEGMIFKGGSGAGVNLSTIRGSKEGLSGGGIASGPVSFMRALDQVAGAIKSGGSTRRAAAIRILNDTHPDIMEFITCKSKEEKKALALIEQGYDANFNSVGGAYDSVQFQNANNSVRISDRTMKSYLESVKKGKPRTIQLKNVTDGTPDGEVDIQEFFNTLAECAHICGDPGLQFHDTTNKYNMAHPKYGEIVATNPCGEHAAVNNTACNLASLNIMKFMNKMTELDIPMFESAVRILIRAMDNLVDIGEYPTEEMTKNAKAMRHLGLGYANLGATIMAMGFPYDSEDARDFAALITSLMTATAWETSMQLRREYCEKNNIDPTVKEDDPIDKTRVKKVAKLHYEAASDIGDRGSSLPDNLSPIYTACVSKWKKIVKDLDDPTVNLKNAQLTLIAPTGCLLSTEMVLSSLGLLPIGKINPDTHKDAAWKDIDIDIMQEKKSSKADKFYSNGYAECYKISTEYGDEISGTGNHKIRIIDKDGNYSWKMLQDIKPGDTTVIKLGGHEEILGNKEYVKLELPEIEDYRDDKFTMPTELTEDIAEFLGFYMGNGYIKRCGGVHVVQSLDYNDLIDKWSQIAANFGTEGHVEHRQDCTMFNICGHYIYRWFVLNGFAKDKGNHGEGTASAFIPDKILESRTSVLKAFIRGLFEADGTICQQENGISIELSTVSKTLQKQLHVALVSLGYQVKSRVQEHKRDTEHKGRRTIYRIRLRGTESCTKFAMEIGFISKLKQSKCGGFVSTATTTRGNLVHHVGLLNDFYKSTSGLNCKLREDIASRLTDKKANISWIKQLIEDEPEYLGTSKIAKLLDTGNFYFAEISNVENIGIQMTYDISVPENNTYIANGFVSHNTISLKMDCDTSGIEPEFALVRYKKLVGGGTIKIINSGVEAALNNLGYSAASITDIMNYIKEHGSVDGCDAIAHKDVSIFDCAIPNGTSGRSISPDGHILMMAAVQPHLDSAISKTVNMPSDCTVDDIKNVFVKSWQLGLKSITIYRDGSKGSQPITTKGNGKNGERNTRRPLPDTRPAITHKFSVAGQEGYAIVGTYEDGTPGELFVKISKEGSTLSGVFDAFAIAISLALQAGVPLTSLISKFSHMSFEPAGFTTNPNIRTASSIVDYIFRWMEQEFGKKNEESPSASNAAPPDKTGPPCHKCGSVTERNGACHKCPNCGETTGCS